jgi:uncharacterized protein DUF4055
MAIPFDQGSGKTSSSPQAGVQSRHPDAAAAEVWYRRVSDVLNGTDAMRSNARQYIPQTAEHKMYPETYEAMVARTPFANYTSRAVDGYEGMIFRKDPSIAVPSRYKPRLENINNAGDGINIFSKKTCRQVICYGRAAVLVDVSPEDQQRDSVPVSRLPYLSLYSASNITNWRPTLIDGQPTVDQVILREFHSIPQEFGSIIKPRYRVLELDPQERYRVRLYDQKDSGDFYLADEGYPRTGNSADKYLHRIPLTFISPVDLSPAVQRPPILDLVDSNIALFLLQSEYANALFWCAQPTLVITGLPEDTNTKLRIGSGNSLMLPEGATAEILEFHGHGLTPLERALAANVDEIADLGARLAQNASTSPETAEAARIRQHSQTSVVSSIARTVSDGIQAALDIACRWAQAEGKISVELNQDYLDVVMAPQMLAEIVRTTREGLMTRKDAVWNMQRGELLQPGRSVEQILDELDEQPPVLMSRPGPLQAIQPVQPGNGKLVNRPAGNGGVKPQAGR